MEAELFQEIYGTLQDRKILLKLPIRTRCPISKFVWSSFNYTVGPELKFVWEADYASDAISLPGSSNDIEPIEEENSSSISSLSKNTQSDTSTYRDQYEDIEAIDSHKLMGDSAYDDVLLSRDLDDLRRFGFTLNHNNETKKEFGSYTDSVPDTATSTFTFCDSQATFHQSPSGKPSQNVMKSEKCDGTTTNSKISIDSEEKIRSQASSRSFTTTSDETRNSSSADDTRERKRPESQISIDDEPPSTLVLSPPLLSEFNEANKRMNNNNNAPMVASCVDSGIANTTSMDSELSALCMGAIASPSLSPSNKPVNKPRYEGAHYNAVDGKCSISTPKEAEIIATCSGHQVDRDGSDDSTHFGPFADADEAHGFKKFIEQQHCSRLVDSRITQSSFLSSSSFMFEQSPKKEHSNLSTDKRDLLEFYAESELMAGTLVNNGMALLKEGESLSDELFVSKYVLSEQAYSTQLGTNPLIQKFQLVPSRHIVVGAFLFSHSKQNSQEDGNEPSISAFSVILPISMSNWYLERQQVFAEFFTDIITRFKTSLFAESNVDSISSLTSDFVSLVEYFGSLDKWPLSSTELTNIKIQSSFLWENTRPGPSEFSFIAKCVTASLICRGRCTVVGSNCAEVQKLMTTLALFMDKNDRLFCLKPLRIPFSPYLRLQAIRRSDLETFYSLAHESHWPIALIDMDRHSVTYSGPYQRHRALKQAFQRFHLSRILLESELLCSEDRNFYLPPPKKHLPEPVLEMRIVHADSDVSELLQNLYLLPKSRMARYAYLDHFQLRLDNRAQALIDFVEETSHPDESSACDKRSPVAAHWSLASMRRALGLQSESALGIVLARAEALLPEFAEFVVQSAIFKEYSF